MLPSTTTKAPAASVDHSTSAAHRTTHHRFLTRNSSRAKLIASTTHVFSVMIPCLWSGRPVVSTSRYLRSFMGRAWRSVWYKFRTCSDVNCCNINSFDVFRYPKTSQETSTWSSMITAISSAHMRQIRTVLLLPKSPLVVWISKNHESESIW